MFDLYKYKVLNPRLNACVQGQLRERQWGGGGPRPGQPLRPHHRQRGDHQLQGEGAQAQQD